jgi:hypothetical protein
MSTSASHDQSAQSIAVASVRRHAMKSDQWQHTVIGRLHPELTSRCCFQPGELPIASGYFSESSWWVVSTRRVIAFFEDALQELDPRHGIDHNFGNFKGIKQSEATGAPEKEVATIRSPKTSDVVRFEFETGNASMAPIYACMFWSRATGFHYRKSDV